MATSTLKAAMFLNNVGVTLVQRRCLPQAFETLSDALEILRVASEEVIQNKESPPAAYNSPLLSSAWKNILQEKISSASSRFAASKFAVTGLQDLRIFKVFDLSSYGDEVEILRRCSTESFSRNKFHLIRMDAIDIMEDEVDDDAISIKSSIILSNMGIAYHCIGASKEKVLAIFDLAFSVLPSQVSFNGLFVRYLAGHTIVMMMVTLSHLAELSNCLERIESCLDYTKRLGFMRENIHKFLTQANQVVAITSKCARAA